MKIEYELMDFDNKVAAILTTVIGKTLDKCIEFYKRVLTTHNRCQTSTTKRLQGFPTQEEHLKYLHDRLQEDELNIQLIKDVNEKVVKGLIAQATVNNFLLEDQLRVTPPRVTEIKFQLSVHEVTVKLLEPMDFRTIATDVATWKQFMDGLVGPT